MANPTTNFGWVMPTATDLVTDLPADFAVFGQGVDTSMQYLLGGTTGQILSKTSGTNMAFTWINNDQGDLTAITAGTGISVTSGTGPIPSVAIDTTITVDKTTAQTLTNKTLTSPIISSISNTGTLTLPTSTDTLVGRATTDTLTNKTLTSPALTTPTISTLTTNGDLVYGTGSGALSRLGIGSTSQVLTVTGGVPVWATPAAGSSFVGAKATSTDTYQSISNNTSNLVLWNSEEYDTSSIHSTSSNTSRLTIPSGKDGYWAVTSKITFVGNSSGARQLRLNKNGSLVANFLVPITGSGEQSIILTNNLNLVATDYLEILAYQNSGGALNLQMSGAEGSYFFCQFLGA
jgi:hypothetical protein